MPLDKINIRDLELFKKQFAEIKPIKHNKISRLRKPKKTTSTQPEANTKTLSKKNYFEFQTSQHLTNIASEEKIFYAKSGIQNKLLRSLQKGQLEIAAKIDLHGLTIEEANIALQKFLTKSLEQNLRLISIIHGKGSHSTNNKITLKSAVNEWLRQSPYILAFCSAQPRDGGAGASYVLLKKII